MSTILLAKELGANPVLLDDYRARKLAKAEGLKILGSVGLLETFYLRHYLTDLGSVFRQLLTHNVYIDQRLLDRRLRSWGFLLFEPSALIFGKQREQKGRRPGSSQAPPLLRQRKPYLTGSPPSRQERRYRQECRVVRV